MPVCHHGCHCGHAPRRSQKGTHHISSSTLFQNVLLVGVGPVRQQPFGMRRPSLQLLKQITDLMLRCEKPQADGTTRKLKTHNKEAYAKTHLACLQNIPSVLAQCDSDPQDANTISPITGTTCGLWFDKVGGPK